MPDKSAQIVVLGNFRPLISFLLKNPCYIDSRKIESQVFGLGGGFRFFDAGGNPEGDELCSFVVQKKFGAPLMG